MTRNNPGELVKFEPEIEAHARRLNAKTRRERRNHHQQQQELIPNTNSDTDVISDTHSESDINEPMAEEDQTIRQLAAAPAEQQPLCITFPNGQTPFELKPGLIHLLPTFHGLPSENPHKHLTEFHMVCSSMKPYGVSEDQIKLRAFPFSLADVAKDWLFYLPSNSVTTWADMTRLFLDRFFPAAKASELRRSILGIRQKDNESLYDYWERFKKLCASCPQHGLTEQTLLQYFYEGLLPLEMKMIDAASGGALVNMTPTAARNLISTMAANSQQFRPINEPTRRVNEISSVSLENKIDKLADIVQYLVAGKIGTSRLCGICTKPDHSTDCCPMLQEDDSAQVNAVGNFPGPPQRQYNPNANTYNPGWRDNSNFSYAQNSRPNQQHQPQKPSLESIVERLALSQEKFQLKTEAHFQEIDKQMSQLTLAVSRLESKGRLPSQTEANPRENVSAITLWSGTVIEPIPRNADAASKTQGEEKLKSEENQKSDAKEKKERKEKSKEEDGANAQERKQGKSQQSPIISPYATPPPFPSRLVKRDKQTEEKEILDVFRKVEINIPLLDVIRKVPRYARFLKNLCTTKRKLTGNEKVNLGENVSAVFQRKLPPKLKDQGMFAIPCKIGEVEIKRAMCDLGASINVMPLSVYNLISTEPLKETRVTVQLADRSVIHPEGVLENVLVKVNELIFPADFYVIDMENDRTNSSPEILLGRPFLSTSHTKIDANSGILTMEFDGEVVKFDVYKAMKYPDRVESINFVGVIKSLAPNSELKLSSDNLKSKGEILSEKMKKLHDRKISHREILSWTKCKNWRKYLSQCM
ncbi:hypothetical protein V6N12_061995 [Hibiscus sabdariffa]|uniref:Retrotransposon gag domain-containing protein n=1 Tax=Hibiscus sabdariffa TaxID=183260 RepID=A0ABR2E0C1_9ROSI